MTCDAWAAAGKRVWHPTNPWACSSFQDGTLASLAGAELAIKAKGVAATRSPITEVSRFPLIRASFRDSNTLQRPIGHFLYDLWHSACTKAEIAAAQVASVRARGQKRELRGQKHRNLPCKDIRMIECPGEITLKVRHFADTRNTGRNGGTGRRAGLKIR
jgi:hypothetical protein